MLGESLFSISPPYVFRLAKSPKPSSFRAPATSSGLITCVPAVCGRRLYLRFPYGLLFALESGLPLFQERLNAFLEIIG